MNRAYTVTFWLFISVNIFLALMGIYSVMMFVVLLFALLGISERLFETLNINPPTLLNLRVTISALCLIFFIAELVLRTYPGLQSYSESMGSIFYRSAYQNNFRPTRSWLHIRTPSISKTETREEYQHSIITNSEGLRDIEHSKTKKPGEFRIIALGDSFTEGAGVESIESTWVKILERSLNKRENSQITTIINGGVAGSDPLYEFVLLKEKLIEYQPDLVLLNINLSDIDDVIINGGNERFNPDGTVTLRNAPWFEPLFGSSFLCRLFVFKVLQYDYRLLSPAERKLEDDKAMGSIVDCITDFEKYATSHNFKMALIIHPTMEEVATNQSGMEELAQRIKSSCSVAVLDLLEYFVEDVKMDQSNVYDYYWPIDRHHTELGYKVYAEGVERKLIELQLIK